MIASLTLVLAVATGPTAAPPECFVVEVSSVGVSAHGATILGHSAPHRLIRALARLPQWVAEDHTVDEATIVALEGATAVNVIPPRATARVEVRGTLADAEPEARLGALERALGGEVAVEPLAQPCGSPAAAGERGP